MAKIQIAATVDFDTVESVKEVMQKTQRSKSSVVQMLLEKGYQTWNNERIARAYQAGNKDE